MATVFIEIENVDVGAHKVFVLLKKHSLGLKTVLHFLVRCL